LLFPGQPAGVQRAGRPEHHYPHHRRGRPARPGLHRRPDRGGCPRLLDLARRPGPLRLRFLSEGGFRSMTAAAYLPPIPRPPHDRTSWLLDARTGWKAVVHDHIEVRPADGALALAPSPGTGRLLAEASGSFGGLRPPSNVAVGPDGGIYLLDLAARRLK